jgi:hypothetical protein
MTMTGDTGCTVSSMRLSSTPLGRAANSVTLAGMVETLSCSCFRRSLTLFSWRSYARLSKSSET